MGRSVQDQGSQALARILDDRFVCVSSDGRMFTKAEILADVKTSDAIQLLMDSMAVRLHGDTAVITGIFRTTGVAHGKAVCTAGTISWTRGFIGMGSGSQFLRS